MPDAFRHAAAAVAATLKRTTAVAISYHRGGAAIELQATPGQSEFSAEDELGQVATVKTDDWLLPAADLVFGGKPTRPQAGDRIQRLIGSALFVYEVSPAGPGEQCFRLDPSGQNLRIHTKEIDGP